MFHFAGVGKRRSVQQTPGQLNLHGRSTSSLIGCKKDGPDDRETVHRARLGLGDWGEGLPQRNERES